MLKSSNLESIIGAVAAESTEAHTVDLPAVELPPLSSPHFATNSINNNTTTIGNATTYTTTNSGFPTNCQSNGTETTKGDSLATLQLSAGFLQIFEPPLVKARGQLKELIGKQNKIYIDLSAEKFKLDNAEIAKLHEMMSNVKIYREKLIKIKKQMQNIYQRTKVLKKRATNVQTCKQRELQRKLQKQQQEEALIGKQQQPQLPQANTNPQ